MAESVYEKELKAIGIALEALATLSQEQQGFALRMISERLGVIVPNSGNKSGTAAAATAGNSAGSDISQMTPKSFLAVKKPKTDMERVACLGYYLFKVRGVEHFKTLDITRLNTEAAGEKFSNAASAVNNSIAKARYLASAGGGKKQISALGEALVENLPDREAVTKALSEIQRKPKRKKRTKKAAK